MKSKRSKTLFSLALVAAISPCQSAPTIDLISPGILDPVVILPDLTNCQTLLNGYYSWAKAKAGNVIKVTMTSNRTSQDDTLTTTGDEDGFSTWSVGSLSYHPAFIGIGVSTPERLEGDATTLLSDQVWREPCPDCLLTNTGQAHPFDPYRSWATSLNISVNKTDSRKASVILTLKDVGVTINFDAQCDGKHMYVGLTH
jgi:hypothetical protein